MAPDRPAPAGCRPRAGPDRKQAAQQFASASALRALWAERRSGCRWLPYVPEKALQLYKQAKPLTPNSIPILRPLRALSAGAAAGSRCAGTSALCRSARGISEGLEHRLENAVRSQHQPCPSCWTALTTVRYPRARMRRLAMDAALGYTADDFPALPPYLHLLGARKEALPLPEGYGAAGVPLAGAAGTRKRRPCARMAAAQSRASDFGALCRGKTGADGREYIVKKLSF